MNILFEIVGDYKRELLSSFKKTDENLQEVISILLYKNFPNIEEFKEKIDKRLERFERFIQETEEGVFHSFEDENNDNVASYMPENLRKEFLYTCKKNKKTNEEKEKIEAHVNKYKDFYSIFQDVLFLPHQGLLEPDSIIDLNTILILEWMDYGLESLSSFLYLLTNNVAHYFCTNSSVNLSSIEAISNFISSTFISVANIGNKISNSIFDVDDFNVKLKQYAQRCGTYEQEIRNKEKPNFYSLYHDKLQEIKGNLKELMPRGSFEIKDILQEITITKDDVHDLEVVEKNYQKHEGVFIKNIFSGIKIFTKLIESANPNDKSGSKDILAVIAAFSSAYDNDSLTAEARSFYVKKCCEWLNSVGKVKYKNSDGILMTSVLVKRYLKILGVFEMMKVEIPKISLLSDISEMLDIEEKNIPCMCLFSKIMVILRLEEDLSRVKKIQSKIQEKFNHDGKIEIDPIPDFGGFQPVAQIAIGGTQPKAKGSGFYEKDEQKFFLKRATKIENLVDDLVETLTSDVCDIIDFDGFARCQPVKSQNTADVFVASACRHGFEELKDMSGRVSSRLLPRERNFLLKLPEKQQNDLRKILFFCNLIGDYDPNPGNLGKIGDDEIVKIDHGWAFDQICNKKIYTWYDIMNPFRYPGRFSPTNALCDYKKLIKNPNISFIEAIIEKVDNCKQLGEKIKCSLDKILQAYEGSRALGSLRDTIEKGDIYRSLCQRFHLDYDADLINNDYLSHWLSLAINIRAHNLYFISLLESMNSFLKKQSELKSEVKKELPSEFLVLLEKLNKQYQKMKADKIPCGNASVVDRLRGKIWKRLEPIHKECDEKDVVAYSKVLFKNKERSMLFLGKNKKRSRPENTVLPEAKIKKLF